MPLEVLHRLNHPAHRGHWEVPMGCWRTNWQCWNKNDNNKNKMTVMRRWVPGVWPSDPHPHNNMREL